jgi:hypothetical protein
MSLKSWKEEFYSIAADEVADNDLDAVRHSIKKWTGLLPYNLEKHEVALDEDFDIIYYKDSDAERFTIDSVTCALCNKYYPCDDCPLFLYLGYRCDYDHSGTTGPYQRFKTNGNPQDMIDALTEIEKSLTKGELKLQK